MNKTVRLPLLKKPFTAVSPPVHVATSSIQHYIRRAALLRTATESQTKGSGFLAIRKPSEAIGLV